MNNLTTKIEADDRSIYEVLNGREYELDYFQREYNWKGKHVEQLVSDLTTAFLNEYHESADSLAG